MRIGVIGGGVSGLACARGLLKAGFDNVVVFDTGKRGVGGRCSSRLASETGWAGAVDHAAQFVEVNASYEPLDEFVSDCVSKGTLRALGGRYVGNARQGIGGFSTALSEGLTLRCDVWVSPGNGLELRGDKRWRVDKEVFDAVVIAHNGKCAQRLTSKLSEAPQIRSLLRAKFGTSPDRNQMTLNSVYSLVFELPIGLLKDVEFFEDATLAFLGDNGAKLGWESSTKVYTALSTGSFGAAHKHPQEMLKGTETEREVTAKLLAAVARLTGKSVADVEPIRSKLQLWGAALPLNKWESDAPFAWDAEAKIGIVGDWISSAESASSLEAAFVSGDSLAKHISLAAGVTRGLEGRFEGATTGFSRPSLSGPPPPKKNAGEKPGGGGQRRRAPGGAGGNDKPNNNKGSPNNGQNRKKKPGAPTLPASSSSSSSKQQQAKQQQGPS